MTTIASQSPSSSQDPSILPPQPSSRRLPPPCWSHDETAALIDAYREKWYSLRRGNLRATHWQEVADEVFARCPPSSGNPRKTSVQCRHKMEKLRKRYRSEIQRAAASPRGHRYCSSWVHFKRMDSMEKGSDPVEIAAQIDEEDEEDEDDDEENVYPTGIIKQGIPLNQQRFYGGLSNGFGFKPAGGSGNGVRIKIPGGGATLAAPAPPPPQMYSAFDGHSSPNPNSGPYGSVRDMGYLKRYGSSSGGSAGKRREETAPANEIVSAIKMLGDGFVRIEKMKMEMAKELESKRLEMEMQRTEMILDSQQRIVEIFSNAISENKSKKVKRMPTPES